MRKLAVKICGVSCESDALMAVELGATHIGLIFVESSRRNVSTTVAAEIAKRLRGLASVVAVVLNPPKDLLAQIQTEVAPNFIQYHGAELPDQYLSGVPAIKALSGDGSAAAFSAYEQLSSHLLFDRVKTDSSAEGGASLDRGEYFSSLESALSITSPSLPFFVAGGIEPANAAGVVSRFSKFEKFHGIDIASGVESSPGVKDEDKIRALFAALNKETGNAISR